MSVLVFSTGKYFVTATLLNIIRLPVIFSTSIGITIISMCMLFFITGEFFFGLCTFQISLCTMFICMCMSPASPCRRQHTHDEHQGQQPSQKAGAKHFLSRIHH